MVILLLHLITSLVKETICSTLNCASLKSAAQAQHQTIKITMQSVLLKPRLHSNILQLCILPGFSEENHCQETELWGIPRRFLYVIQFYFYFFINHSFDLMRKQKTSKNKVTAILFPFCKKTVLANYMDYAGLNHIIWC